MKLKDKLTPDDRTLGIFIVVALSALLLILGGCSHNHPYKQRHSVIIEAENIETYHFSNILPDSFEPYSIIAENGQELPNGHMYAYTVENGEVTVTSAVTPEQVRFYEHGATSKYELLEVENNTFSYTPEEYGHLIILYPWDME